MSGTRYSFVPGRHDSREAEDAPERNGSDRPTAPDDLCDDVDGRPTPLIADPLGAAMTLRPHPDHSTGSWSGLLEDIGGGPIDAVTLCHKYGFSVESLSAVLALVASVRKGDETAIDELKRLWAARSD